MQLSPRSQRLRSRKVEPTHQLIVFRLQQEQFALPIQAVQKVIPLGNVYGAGLDTVGLTLYHDREISVLNIQQRIFRTVNQPLLLADGSLDQASLLKLEAPSSGRFLLIIETLTEGAIGLPLYDQPMLRRVPESAFVPLSDAYLSGGHLRCVKCLIVLASDQPPIFLLHLDQLLQAQPALPESQTAQQPLLKAQIDYGF